MLATTAIDFDFYSVDPFGRQDRTGQATIEDDGASLHLEGNLWKTMLYKIEMEFALGNDVEFRDEKRDVEHVQFWLE